MPLPTAYCLLPTLLLLLLLILPLRTTSPGRVARKCIEQNAQKQRIRFFFLNHTKQKDHIHDHVITTHNHNPRSQPTITHAHMRSHASTHAHTHTRDHTRAHTSTRDHTHDGTSGSEEAERCCKPLPQCENPTVIGGRKRRKK
jgi:hypothetical protein